MEISNIVHTGTGASIGSFSSGSTSIGLSSGVILATSDIAYATGPNNSTGAGGFIGGAADPDLSMLTGLVIYDASVLEFDFTPTQSGITFSFVFASEEYCDYIGSQFSDAFGVFLSGPGISGPFSNNSVNIAVLPGGGGPITTNNLNHITNSSYYIGNIPQGDPQFGDPDCAGHPFAFPPSIDDCQYDGFSVVITVQAAVVPFETYHIKFAIGDGADGNFDSGVFLEAGSFIAGGNSTPLEISFQTDSLCLGQPAAIAPVLSGGGPPYAFLWSNGSQDSIYEDTPLQEGMISLTVTDQCGQSVSDSIQVTPCIFLPWEPVECLTGIVHTIAVLNDVVADIDGQPLAPGDLIGYFHEGLNGELVCNNFGVWQGNVLSLDLCGDDPGTPNEKEGFSIGETIQVIIWKDFMEYTVIPCYLPEDYYSNNNPNAAGEFQFFGLSYITCLESPPPCHVIELKAGTNFISSNIVPVDPAIEVLLPADPLSPIIVIENQFNQSYSPSVGTDPSVFDDWDFRKAYRIKCLTPTTIQLCGEPADPETPIPYTAETPQGLPINNWSAYLKELPELVGNLFNATLSPEIFRVWNMPTSPSGNLTPQSYLPLIPAGLNFTMERGRGYIVNAEEDGEFVYNFGSQPLETRGLYPSFVDNGCDFFRTPLFSGLNAATLIFPKDLLESQLSKGDEIAVFNTGNLLFAAGKFEDYAVSMVVPGDDPASSQVEGLREGEQMIIQVWDQSRQQSHPVTVSFQCGYSSFENEQVYIATGWEILENTSTDEPSGAVSWSIFPNPAAETIRFNIQPGDEEVLSLGIFTLNGQLASQPEKTGLSGEISVGQLPAGVYIMRLTTTRGVSLKKLVIAR